MQNNYVDINSILDDQKDFFVKTRQPLNSIIGRSEPTLGDFDQVDQAKGPNSDRETRTKEKEVPEKEREKEKESESRNAEIIGHISIQVL